MVWVSAAENIRLRRPVWVLLGNSLRLSSGGGGGLVWLRVKNTCYLNASTQSTHRMRPFDGFADRIPVSLTLHAP